MTSRSLIQEAMLSLKTVALGGAVLCRFETPKCHKVPFMGTLILSLEIAKIDIF
jgi:hypothetical protein